VNVIHVFQEDDEVGRDSHLRYWYGTVRPDVDSEDLDELDELDEPVVCWCGGRHIKFRFDTAVIWHVQSWHDRGL